jgi:hypothetical protein
VYIYIVCTLNTDICPPDPNVTCGLDGQNTTILFIHVKQIDDSSSVSLYRNNIQLDAALLFGNPTDYAASVVENLRPLNRERFLGLLVINASSVDRGVYNCNILLLSCRN